MHKFLHVIEPRDTWFSLVWTQVTIFERVACDPDWFSNAPAARRHEFNRLAEKLEQKVFASRNSLTVFASRNSLTVLCI